jgi:hypothetical protein
MRVHLSSRWDIDPPAEVAIVDDDEQATIYDTEDTPLALVHEREAHAVRRYREEEAFA